MRARWYVFLGMVALLVLSPTGLTQPPSGGRDGSRGDRGGFGDKGGFGRGSGGPGGGFSRDPGEAFDRMANGKNVLIRSEMDPRRQGFFDMVAGMLGVTNGQLTRDQFTEGMSKMRSMGPGGFGRGLGGPGGGPAAAGGPGAGSDAFAEMRFRRYDLNGDGLLNNDEIPDTLRAEREKWDTNRDGFIDLSEYKGYFNAVMQQRQQENGGPGGGFGGLGGYDVGGSDTPPEDDDKKPTVYRAGKLPKELPDWFQKIDVDNDAQIGLYEWKKSGRPLDEFKKWDRNNDGFITINEVLFLDALAKNSDGNSNGNVPSSGQNPMAMGMGGRGFGGPGGFSPGGGAWGGGRGFGPGGFGPGSGSSGFADRGNFGSAGPWGGDRGKRGDRSGFGGGPGGDRSSDRGGPSSGDYSGYGRGKKGKNKYGDR